MTTTRINHTGHNHPSTTAARTACRNGMKTAAPVLFPAATVGRGKSVHLANLADDQLVGVLCGAGLTRSGRDSEYYRAGRVARDGISCRSCATKEM